MEMRRMTDKEKVFKGLELCIEQGISDTADCSKCPYYTTSERLTCWISLLFNALKLLEEQEIIYIKDITRYYNDGYGDGIKHTENQNAVEPIQSNESWYCGHCFEKVGETRAYANATGAAGIQKVRHKYCPECGRKVKWE